jgi:hypothetical protein
MEREKKRRGRTHCPLLALCRSMYPPIILSVWRSELAGEGAESERWRSREGMDIVDRHIPAEERCLFKPVGHRNRLIGGGKEDGAECVFGAELEDDGGLWRAVVAGTAVVSGGSAAAGVWDVEDERLGGGRSDGEEEAVVDVFEVCVGELAGAVFEEVGESLVEHDGGEGWGGTRRGRRGYIYLSMRGRRRERLWVWVCASGVGECESIPITGVVLFGGRDNCGWLSSVFASSSLSADERGFSN